MGILYEPIAVQVQNWLFLNPHKLSNCARWFILTFPNIILYQYLVLNVVNRRWFKNRMMFILRNIRSAILWVARYSTFREIDFWFISNWNVYDRSDSLPSDSESNENLVHNLKENCHDNLIPFNFEAIRNLFIRL